MKKFTTLLLAILLVLPAMAASIPAGTKLYLDATNWGYGDAKFAAYFWTNDETLEMTSVAGKAGFYEVTTTQAHENVIFKRMNPSAAIDSWADGECWNKTPDLTLDDTKNLFTIEGWSYGSWGVYGEDEELVIPEGVLSFNEGEYVVFFVNTKNWDEVSAYAWSPENAAWPGVAMEIIEGVQINEKYDVYEFKPNQQYSNIIFNNNNNGAKTADLEFTNGGVYDGNGALITIIEPTEVVVPTISSVSYSPTKAFVNEPVTFSANTLNADDLTVEFLINDEVVDNPWTPTEVGTYTLTATLNNAEGVVVTSEPQTIAVKEHTSFTVYLKKYGAWETTKIHYWGEIGTEWPGVAMAETTVDEVNYFYHTFEDVESINVIFNNKVGNDGEQTVDITNVTEDSFYELGEKNGESKYTVKDVTIYDANITAGFYYLTPGAWESDGAWFAMYLFDMNNGNPSTWVTGWLTNHNVAFKYEGQTAYTHMIFCRMNPEFDKSAWDEYDGETLVADRVWNQTEDIIYEVPEEGYVTSYYITSLEDPCKGEWRQELLTATGLDRVELADGIGYAYGVVSAEGAIEVYNVNGAVVARGNDNVDLRGLGRGVYIIRNGNQVRKVVR